MSVTSYDKTLKNGTVRTYHRVAFYDESGKRKFRNFTTKREALAFNNRVGAVVDEMRAAKEMVAPTAEAKAVPTFEEATTEFIEASRKGRDGGVPLEPTSLSAYRQCFDRMKGREFYKLPLNQVTRDHMRGLRDFCLSDARGLSRSTTRSTLTAAKVLFNWAIEEGYVLSNPTLKVKVAKDVRAGEGEPVRREAIHSRAEVKVLLDKMDDLANATSKVTNRAWLRYRPMVQLALLAGLRLSEVRGLPWKSVNLDAATVTITQRADATGAIGQPKTANSYRTLPIPDRVVEAIRAWLPIRTQGVGIKPDDLLFPEFGKMDEAVDPQNFGRNCWRKLIATAKVKRLKFHSTRHFYASAHIANGTNAKDLCALMGHHSEAFTLRVYGHLFDEAQDEERRRGSVDAVAAMVL